MRTAELTEFLQKIVSSHNMTSIMIWGAPGIGKSSIVAQIGEENRLPVIDLRLSQLAPTDLRGLPVPDQDQEVSRWFPPEFLPQDGAGILFLDEINLAPPAMQGMAQQLILDRRVGSYVVPHRWFVWAAGNRKEDRGSTFDMPAPLANRFLHLEVEANLGDFESHVIKQGGIDAAILAFLAFRPELLHKMTAQQAAWPSPRSWMMANGLLKSGIDDIAPAVGDAVAAEFLAFRQLQSHLPSVEKILGGHWKKIDFPAESSVRYALLGALIAQAANDQERGQIFAWLTVKASPEWLQTFLTDLKKRGLGLSVPEDESLRKPLLETLAIIQE